MVHEIEFINILKFKAENKLTKKDIILLLGVFKRKNVICSSDPTYGLGTAAQYKSIYFTFHYSKDKYKHEPRVLYWFELSEKGNEMMKKMEEFFGVPNTGEEKNKCYLQIDEYINANYY